MSGSRLSISRLRDASALHARRVVVAHALQPFIERLARGVEDFHRYAVIGERHRDAATHRAGADDRRTRDARRLEILRRAGDLRHFALGEERIAQRLRFVGVLELGEEPALGLEAFFERLAVVAASTAAMQ